MTPTAIRQATVDALAPLEATGVRVFDSRMFAADAERDVAKNGPIVSVHWLGAGETLMSGPRLSTRTERLAIVGMVAGQSTDADCADEIAALEGDIRDALFASDWLRLWADVTEVTSEVTLEAGASRFGTLALRVSVRQNAIRYVPTVPTQTGHKHMVTTDQPPVGDPETIASLTLAEED